MAGILVPPFKPSGTDSIIPRSTTITKIFGNTGGFSLSVGGTAASTAQLDVVAASSSTIGQIIKGASSQSVDFLELLDNSNNVRFKIDKNSNIFSRVTATTFTGSNSGYILNSSTVTHNTDPSNPGDTVTLGLIVDGATYNQTAAAGSGSAVASTSISLAPKYKNDSSVSGLTLSGVKIGVGASINVQSDTNSTTQGNFFTFQDIPTLDAINNGTLTVTDLVTLRSAPFIKNTTGTVNATKITGVRIEDIATSGAGTKSITTHIGLDISDFATTATTRIAVRQSGTNAHNQVQGDTSFGQLAAPSTSKVQIVGDTTTNRVLTLKAVSSQSANILDITDSSNNVLTSASSDGRLFVIQQALTQSAVSTPTSFGLISIGEGTPTHTLDSASSSITSILRGLGTFKYTTTAAATTTIHAARFTHTIINATSLTGSLGNANGISYQPTITGDTNATTFTESRAFRDGVVYSVANSGTLAVTAHSSLYSAVTVGAGVTLTTRRGISIQDASVSGTLTTNIGIDIENFAATAGTKIAIRQQGTAAHNQIQGKTNIGALSAPNENLHVDGSVSFITRTITDNLTIDTTTNDMIILCNFSAAKTVTLPTPTNGRTIIIKDISGTAGGGTNTITLARHGSEKIDGTAASKVFQTDWGAWTIVSDGTDWFVA